MNTNRILSDQVIVLKRGRINSYGFEPCSNSYFDFYACAKYLTKPLIKLEDISFHLYLRKNLNDTNPSWRMPTIHQMMTKLCISYSRLSSIMTRLEAAHLLKKESGCRAGEDGKNVRNHYILSDPIQTLEEFLEVADAGVFPYVLKREWSRENRDTNEVSVAKTAIPESRENRDDQHSSSIQQTWEKILSSLKVSMLPQTFSTFLADTTLELEGQTAIIKTPNTFAHDWIENRMKSKLLKELQLELEVEDLRCMA